MGGVRPRDPYRATAAVGTSFRSTGGPHSATKCHEQVCEKGFDAEKNSFVQSYGSDQLDASLLMLARVGFLPPDDPRIIGTVEAIQRELVVDGFVLRYLTGDDGAVDGLPPGDGTFLMTTFWLADNLALIGRTDEARELFERLRALSNDVGLFAEEYDPKAKRMLGNFPQAFSHLAFVTSAGRRPGAVGALADGVHARVPHHPGAARRVVGVHGADRQLPRDQARRRRRAARSRSGGRSTWR